jgi:hypothetical protein
MSLENWTLCYENLELVVAWLTFLLTITYPNESWLGFPA